MPLDMPTAQDEIERKTREHLVCILYRLDEGEITVERALGAMDALWAVSSGLVPKSLMNLVNAASDRLRLMAGHD